MTVWQKISGLATAVTGAGGSLLGGLASFLGLDWGASAPEKGITFTIGVIALSAKMAKADGVVVPIEVSTFRKVFAFEQAQEANVSRVFDLAKQDVAGFESYARQIAELLKDDRKLLQNVLEGLMLVAIADGIVHPKEDAFLAAVSETFGFSEGQYRLFRARFVRDVDSPYEVLRIAPDASNAEVKARYRALVIDNHPDKLMGRGVPPEFIELANRKLAAINAAYEAIVRERGAVSAAPVPISQPDSRLVDDLHPSLNFGPRTDATKPDLLLLHYTGVASAAAAISWLADPRSQVSCHYVIDLDGRITQMVAEADRAWHAGAGSWAGESDINSRSIGIEIQNVGHVADYPEFPGAQIAAVIALCQDIIARHDIRPERVLAHSDVAPMRKVDPGEKFPWGLLAAAGVGHWVGPSPIAPGDESLDCDSTDPRVAQMQTGLRAYGYGIDITGVLDTDTAFVVKAFQRHFRPERVDGRIDASSLATLDTLQAALRASSLRARRLPGDLS